MSKKKITLVCCCWIVTGIIFNILFPYESQLSGSEGVNQEINMYIFRGLIFFVIPLFILIINFFIYIKEKNNKVFIVILVMLICIPVSILGYEFLSYTPEHIATIAKEKTGTYEQYLETYGWMYYNSDSDTVKYTDYIAEQIEKGFHEMKLIYNFYTDQEKQNFVNAVVYNNKNDFTIKKWEIKNRKDGNNYLIIYYNNEEKTETYLGWDSKQFHQMK